MGDQKEHILLQKKETESSTFDHEAEKADPSAASIPPPDFNLEPTAQNVKQESQEEGIKGEGEKETGLEFDVGGDPPETDETPSKILDKRSHKTTSINHAFRLPVVNAPNRIQRKLNGSFRLKPKWNEED